MMKRRPPFDPPHCSPSEPGIFVLAISVYRILNYRLEKAEFCAFCPKNLQAATGVYVIRSTSAKRQEVRLVATFDAFCGGDWIDAGSRCGKIQRACLRRHHHRSGAGSSISQMRWLSSFADVVEALRSPDIEQGGGGRRDSNLFIGDSLLALSGPDYSERRRIAVKLFTRIRIKHLEQDALRPSAPRSMPVPSMPRAAAIRISRNASASPFSTFRRPSPV